MNKPEFSGRPEHIPSLATIATAYKDIVDHNNTHTGLGAAMSGMIGALIKEDTDETPVGDTLSQKKIEGDMNAELQDLFHSDTFTRIGLKISSFGEHEVDTDEFATSAELVPIVTNTSLYTEFLSTLTPKNAEDESNALLLRDVINNLQRTIAVCYQPLTDVGLSDDERQIVRHHGEDALRTFTQIDPQYKRLGLGNEESYRDYLAAVAPDVLVDEYNAQQFLRNYRGLEKAVEYWGKDVLPEYIEGSDYITPPEEETFSPAHWHKDGGQRHWKGALKFVARMESDERTKTFGGEVRQALITSLVAAVEEIDLADVKSEFAGQREDLLNIRNFLSGEKHDRAKLDKYIKDPHLSE